MNLRPYRPESTYRERNKHSRFFRPFTSTLITPLFSILAVLLLNGWIVFVLSCSHMVGFDRLFSPFYSRC